MPTQPSANQLHVNRLLTNVAVRYAQEESSFISGQVFPNLPVQKKSDFYLIFPRDYFFRDDMGIRPIGGRPKRTGYEIEHGSYNAEEWSLEHAIDDRERENADEPINPDLRGTELLTEKGLIHRDREWAEHFFVESKWSVDWEGVAKASEEKETSTEHKFVKFSNYTEGEPIKFMDRRATEMKETTGRRPNVLVLGANVYVALKNHPSIVERIKYTINPPAVVTTGILASLFDVERVLVAESIYNTAAEGETLKAEFISNPKAMLLCYAAPAPSITIPSAGYTFAWTGLLPGVSNAWGGVIYKGREDLAHTDILQIRATYDMQITSKPLGMFFKEAVA
jgi:hypothetical protein